ncbi:MAG TPA: uroporphyrinogen-III synthase [Caldimonas sp.]|nr:uroporphyrinogen-III synthase [Caldimonas sp.]HEX4235224.1 uroporphyrinogen-III synthase [Caldimonas sp.]
MSAARSLRVLVTRPAAQAAVWVDRLRQRGIDAEALPLIEIAATDDVAPLDAAWQALATFRLVVFVSANAVEQFFAVRPEGATWPEGVDAGAPGAGTAEALRAAGCPQAAIVSPPADAGQFDSEALWDRLHGRDWNNARVLVVRGDGGRDWLAERLVERGARVEMIGAYRRVAPTFAGAARERLEAAAESADVVWLFSSSEAIANLARAAGSDRWRSARAIATHPRIAARARALGFGVVREAGAAIDAVVACIQSIEP